MHKSHNNTKDLQKVSKALEKLHKSSLKKFSQREF